MSQKSCRNHRRLHFNILKYIKLFANFIIKLYLYIVILQYIINNMHISVFYIKIHQSHMHPLFNILEVYVNKGSFVPPL